MMIVLWLVTLFITYVFLQLASCFVAPVLVAMLSVSQLGSYSECLDVMI